MKFIKSLNAASSQVWAAVLIFTGIACFALACFCKMADVRAALLGGGTTLIGGGIGMFQHQSASQKQTDPPAAVDTAAIPAPEVKP